MENTNFINECKNRANANRLGKIKIEGETSSTGNTLNLSECLEKNINKLSLYGRCEQETSSNPLMPSPDNPSEIECVKGINLLKGLSTSTTDTDYWYSVSTPYFTPLEDGWGKFEYDNTSGTSTIFANAMVNLSAIDLKPSTTYTFVVEIRNSTISENSNAYLQVITANATGAFKTGRLIGYQDINENKTIVFNSTTKDSFNGVTRGVDTYLILGTGTKGTVEARISLFEYGNNTSNTYVPYNSIQSKIVGKNLFDKNSSETQIGYFTNDGTLKGGGSSTVAITYTKIVPNNDMTISGIKLEWLCFYDKNKNFIERIAGERGSTSNTFNKNANYIRFQASTSVFDLDKIQLELGTQATEYKSYQEKVLNIDLQGNELCSLPNNIKDELVVETGRAKIIKNTRHISLAIKDMNNNENFPGWRNVPFLRDDYPNQNSLLDNITSSFLYNIGVVSEHRIAINTTGSGSTLYLSKSHNKLTQSQWKEQYPNLVVDLYYKVPQPYEIDLGAIEQPKTFEGVNNISNSENADMSVIYSNWNKMITNSDNLQNFEIDSGCYINGNIIGSVYVKCLKVSLVADTSKLADKNMQAQIGVKYANLSNEYINMGKYTTEHQNSEITANMSQITAYSDLYTKLDDKYVSNIDYKATNEDGTLITRTVSDLYIDVCNQLGLIPVKTIFTNSDIPISDNPFTNGEKNRIVLQTISKIACAFVDIDVDTNKIDLCWLSGSEEPDYTFYKNDYSNVDGGQVICGPINCLIIKNSQVDDENVTIKDDDDIALNGEHSIIISEDYILYDAELRQQAITSIWNKVKGMKYVDCKLTTYYGKPFLKLGDKIRVYTSATEYFDTYVLKHNFKYDGSFTSVIESPALTEQEIKTKQNITLSEALKNTEISINKQNQKIELISKKSDDTSEQMSNLTQTVNGFDMTIKDVQKELNSASGKVQTLEGTITDMNFNFSTKGLSIGTSSDSNNSLLDNTGIRVYNYNKLNAIFNNKGSGIDKLIVTGTAQIGYLKFVKSVKNNKKVTKIYHLKELIEDLEDLEV